MKVKIIDFINVFCVLNLVLLNFTSCSETEKTEFTKTSGVNTENSYSLNICENSVKTPKGKGELFRVNKLQAIKVLEVDYIENTKGKSQFNLEQLVCCETIFSWHIFSYQTKTEYVVNKITGKVITKRNLPIDVEEIVTGDLIEAGKAVITSQKKFEEYLFNLGYSSSESKDEINKFNINVCSLSKYWLVMFDFDYYKISDLNTYQDLKNLPNTHSPSYLIDKETGSFTLYSY